MIHHVYMSDRGEQTPQQNFVLVTVATVELCSERHPLPNLNSEKMNQTKDMIKISLTSFYIQGAESKRKEMISLRSATEM